jgi:hypothetical protein
MKKNLIRITSLKKKYKTFGNSPPDIFLHCDCSESKYYVSKGREESTPLKHFNLSLGPFGVLVLCKLVVETPRQSKVKFVITFKYLSNIEYFDILLNHFRK